MLKDRFGRKIDYLRISLTDRCNLRCIYCHDGFFKKFPRSSVISTEELLLLVKFLKDRGLKKVKLTGGEPLLRKDIANIVRLITNLGLELSLTTNGVLLAKLAQSLYAAGLRRVNVGLDCLDANIFKKITGFDKFKQVLNGIDAAIKTGFSPVKINVILIERLNDQIEPWIDFIAKKDVIVRFIEVMPFVNGYIPVSNDLLKRKFLKYGELNPVSVAGCGPAKNYSIKGFKGKVGFISPFSDNFCSNCNRLRINALGQIRNCLFSADTYDFLSLARNGYSEEKLAHLMDSVLNNKPKNNKGLSPVENMCQIGG